MKTINAILFTLLIILAVYLIYKLIGIGEFSRTDRILFVLLIAGSFVQSGIRSRLKKKQGENNPTNDAI